MASPKGRKKRTPKANNADNLAARAAAAAAPATVVKAGSSVTASHAYANPSPTPEPTAHVHPQPKVVNPRVNVRTKRNTHKPAVLG